MPAFWASLEITVNTFAKPCVVIVGLVAAGSIIGMPAFSYTRDAGSVVPELKWPTTTATPSSTSFCAACTPTRGSAWSSSAAISKCAVLPPILMFFALASSSASCTPFCRSLP